jgi:hypothetical protein
MEDEKISFRKSYTRRKCPKKKIAKSFIFQLVIQITEEYRLGKDTNIHIIPEKRKVGA